MRQAIIALLAILMLTLGLSAGYFGGVSSRQTTTVTATTTDFTTIRAPYSFQRCDMSYDSLDNRPTTIEGTKSNTSVILFYLNSTASVCVDIRSTNINSTAYGRALTPLVLVDQKGQWVTSTGLNETVYPPLQFPANTDSWFVFRITVVNATPAIYLLGFPNQCWSFPFAVTVAVGYPVPQLQQTVFNLPNYVNLGCSLGDGYSYVVGYSNLTATYTK
ncbi:MAG: hypothetical protein JRN21_05490 [Nitrososphaerota archaeon]|nr:hypothetical protein [Nitrososphaerota archaeon]